MVASSFRTLQVIVGPDRRGAETFALDLEGALEDMGHAVATVALGPGGHAEGLDVEVLGPSRTSRHTLGRLRSRARDYDVVVAHGSTTLLACGVALAGAGTPFVYRSIGDPTYWASSVPKRIRTGLLLHRAARIAALWPGAAQATARLYRMPADRIDVIPNAVPEARVPLVTAPARRRARDAYGIANGQPVVAYLGALSPEKGLDALIDAVAHVAGIRLLVGGDGPQRGELSTLAAARLQDRATFVGSVRDPAAFLAAADVVALPSRTEGMPGVLIEAGLAGLPVVATDVGGVAEIVVDGETGRLVPPGDASALVGAIEQTVAHAGDWGAAGRSRCLAQFTMPAIAQAWNDVLATVLGGGR